MNGIGIDYGTKNIGVALSIKGIITPLAIYQNDQKIFDQIQKIISEYQIDTIYVGLSMGKMAELTLKFVDQLKLRFHIPLETVDESLSTIESAQYVSPSSKHYQNKVDAISAAIILRRALL